MSRSIRLAFAIIALLGLVAGVSVLDMTAASAATYYVSNSGSDSSAGTRPTAAWQTIARVNTQSFNPGDFILFQSSSIWRETLVPFSSGSAGNPITFGFYGPGNQPIISAANLATWTQGTAGTSGGPDVFGAGMETSSFGDWVGVSAPGATLTQVQAPAPVAHGTYAMALTGNGTDNRGCLTTPTFTPWTNNSTYYRRVYVYIPTGALNTAGPLKYLTTPKNDQFSFNWSGTAINGMGFVGANGVYVTSFATSAITLDTWHCVELKYTVSATAGGVQAFVDGTSISSSFNHDTSADVGQSTFYLATTRTAASWAAARLSTSMISR